MANIVTETFNSGLGAWTAADFTTRSFPGEDLDINGSAMLVLTAGNDDGTERIAYFGTDCTPNHSIAAKRIGNGGSATRYTSVFARMPAADPTTYYELRDVANVTAGIGAQLFKNIAGVKTSLASGITKSSNTDGVVTKLTLTVSASTVVGRIQRLDDNTYLASDGSWSASAVDCFSVTDTSISPSGDCRAGVLIRSTNTYRDAVDDVVIDSIVVVDPPEAPTSFTMTAVGTTGINVSWTDPDADATSFQLQIDTANTFDTPDLQNFTVTSSGQVAATFEPGTTYYGRIRGENAGGVGSWSSTQSVTLTSPLMNAAIRMRLRNRRA